MEIKDESQKKEEAKIQLITMEQLMSFKLDNILEKLDELLKLAKEE